MVIFVSLILLYILNSAVSEDKFVSDDVVSRIIMGTQAPIEEYPFFARIKNGGHHRCGAAIISDRWLLTAAHCIDRNNVYIVGGDKENNSNTFIADGVVIHPYYALNSISVDNDIALVRLASRLQFSNTVQFIRLPTSNEIKGQLLGIGRGLNEYGLVPPCLMKVNVMEVDITYCGVDVIKKIYFICVTRSPVSFANICRGDSGSPLVSYEHTNATLVGITSFITNPNCLHNRYSAFVRVSHYVPWVKTMISFYGV